MRTIILGSAAGGGVPQWNCRCSVCVLAWAGDPRVRPRTQSSIAISADGENWLLINASPDIRQQIITTHTLHPQKGLRHSPIKGVLLTNGDVDHIAGLLTLRESQAFDLFATSEILTALHGNRVFDALSNQCVSRRSIRLKEAAELVKGLNVMLFPVPGKVPLWLENGEPVIGEASENTVGVRIETKAHRLAYIPGCAAITDELVARIDNVDLLLFDGTVFEDDDIIRAGVGNKTGWRMGHVPMRGERGSLTRLSDLGARKVFVHLNNTNPVLIEDSAERYMVEEAGWTVAHDGMVINL
jgi:pyrroloquinoline quinone biosynthesis protein B